MYSFIEWAKNINFFNYKKIAENHWLTKLKVDKKKFGINFDTENDEAIAQRVIKIGDNKFNCEMRMAGGDWETPIAYFRCQLVDGYISNLVFDQFFTFIPGKDQGNQHLERTKKGWEAPQDSRKGRPDDKKCWKSLKDYLIKLCKKDTSV